MKSRTEPQARIACGSDQFYFVIFFQLIYFILHLVSNASGLVPIIKSEMVNDALEDKLG